MIDNQSGKRWARFGLGLGATLSILGNETHTVLAHSHVNLIIRVVLAFVWPAGLFVAVEIFVRVAWRRRLIDYLGRFILLGPVSAVAAVVSYQHIHALMLLGGEDTFSALAGPVAIDGLMIGSTVALLAIRAAALAAPSETPALEVPALDDWDTAIDELTAAPIGTSIHETIENFVQADKRTRTPRGQVDPRQEQAVAMLIDGADKLAVLTSGISPATYGRLAKVHRELHDDPHAVIDPATAKVRPELIDTIRAAMRQEAVR
jgi:hypothetical protein